MDPSKVKLPIYLRVKVLWQVLKERDEWWWAAFGICLLLSAGFCMAMCVPSFMTGPISNGIMKVILTTVFSLIFVSIPALFVKVWQEDIEPRMENIKGKYEKNILPYQKQEMEKVDDILLK